MVVTPFSVSFFPRVSAVLGICEERSKMYKIYIARAQKQITTHSATSTGRVDGSAVKQASTARRKK